MKEHIQAAIGTVETKVWWETQFATRNALAHLLMKADRILAINELRMDHVITVQAPTAMATIGAVGEFVQTLKL